MYSYVLPAGSFGSRVSPVAELLRKEPQDFSEPGVKLEAAPYLGPVLMEGNRAIQRIYEQRLLPEPVRQLLFSEPETWCHEVH